MIEAKFSLCVEDCTLHRAHHAVKSLHDPNRYNQFTCTEHVNCNVNVPSMFYAQNIGWLNPLLEG